VAEVVHAAGSGAPAAHAAASVAQPLQAPGHSAARAGSASPTHAQRSAQVSLFNSLAVSQLSCCRWRPVWEGAGERAGGGGGGAGRKVLEAACMRNQQRCVQRSGTWQV
jgi:hypothetical protein